MTSKHVTKCHKNVIKVALQKLMSDIELECDDNSVGKDCLREHFREAENVYRDYQKACSSYGRHLDKWGDVDPMARLRRECTRMEHEYQDLYEVVQKRLAQKESTQSEKPPCKSDEEMRQSLFSETACWEGSEASQVVEAEVVETRIQVTGG